MRVFPDADVLFDSVDDSRTSTLLRRIKNAGHEIILPASVLGEIMLICIAEDREEDLLCIRNTCSELKPLFIVSLEQSAICNLCLRDFDNRSFNRTDKDHLAHALAYSSAFNDGKENYFLTTDLYMLDLMLPCIGQKRKCCLFNKSTVLRIVDKEGIRRLL
jgi:hypothetical protein